MGCNCRIPAILQPYLLFVLKWVVSPGLMHGPLSYLKEFDNVYVSAVGTSFYSQCVPSGSVHLGFSAAAFHWLSER